MTRQMLQKPPCTCSAVSPMCGAGNRSRREYIVTRLGIPARSRGLQYRKAVKPRARPASSSSPVIIKFNKRASSQLLCFRARAASTLPPGKTLKDRSPSLRPLCGITRGKEIFRNLFSSSRGCFSLRPTSCISCRDVI